MFNTLFCFMKILTSVCSAEEKLEETLVFPSKASNYLLQYLTSCFMPNKRSNCQESSGKWSSLSGEGGSLNDGDFLFF